MLRPPGKKRYKDYFEGKLSSKCGVERELGSSLVTRRMAVPFMEGEGGPDEVPWGAVTFALSVGPLSGVPICSWLLPYVLVILHPLSDLPSAFLYPALGTRRLASVACLIWCPCPLASHLGSAGEALQEVSLPTWPAVVWSASPPRVSRPPRAVGFLYPGGMVSHCC